MKEGGFVPVLMRRSTREHDRSTLPIWRKLGLLVCAVVAAGTLSNGKAQETGQAPDTQSAAEIISAQRVNLRTCPGLDCEVRSELALGERVTITGEMVDGFVPVSAAGGDGWIWNLYVTNPGGETPELRKGDPGCQRVALIFNIGIGGEVRLPVLEHLKEEQVPATLFPMGWWVDENPELFKRMAELGFDVGSHGNVQGELTLRDDDEISADVRTSFATIERVIEEEPEPYFTPYAADIDERVRKLVAEQGYLPVGWDVPAADYGEGVTATDVYERVVPNVYDGAIIEFHLDGPATAQSTEIALPRIVDELRAQGYHFVTISEMAAPCER